MKDIATIYEVHRLRRCGSSRRWILELSTAFQKDALYRAQCLLQAGYEVRIRPAKY